MTNNEHEIISNSSDQVGLTTVDDVTLSFMVNTAQYEKYLKKNNLAYDSLLKRDIRFYRKRIISLTKDLFKNQVENDKSQNIDATMMGAFNMYMRACISYLKFSDQSETIQKCYVCSGMTNNNNNNNNNNDGDNSQNENIKIQKCICVNKNKDELFELQKANELCLKPKEVKKITLDNYVIRKNVKKSEPIIYPQQFTFNPRDPSFKHKGLKPKSPSRSQSAEKIRVESNSFRDPSDFNNKVEDVAKHSNELLNRVITTENGENREKNIKNSNEKKKKNKKKKKVSFDVTNSVDII
jgi:hypothetical protein